MELLEKVAYLKGLMSGLELEADKKETKVFNAILDVLDDLASTVTDMQEETDEMCELIDVLDEDLGEVEKVVYGADPACFRNRTGICGTAAPGLLLQLSAQTGPADYPVCAVGGAAAGWSRTGTG